MGSTNPSLLLSLTNLGESVEFDVAPYTQGSIGAAVHALSGAWGAAVVTIEGSVDGLFWAALKPDPLSFTDEGISWRLDLQGISRIRARTSTAATVGFPVARVAFYGNSDE